MDEPGKMQEELYRLREKVARLEEQRMASEKALSLASSTLEAYKQTNNEWRATLQDNNARFITHAEVRMLFEKAEAEHKTLESTVRALEKSRSEIAGKSSGFGASWLIVVVVATIAVNVASVVIAGMALARIHP